MPRAGAAADGLPLGEGPGNTAWPPPELCCLGDGEQDPPASSQPSDSRRGELLLGFEGVSYTAAVPNSYAFVSYSSLTVMSGIQSTMLSGSGTCGHPCLVLEF